MSDWPEWVRRRVTAAVMRKAWCSYEMQADAALAEFLRIIEERAGPGWQVVRPARTDTVPWTPWKTIPLAELLRDEP